MEDLCELTRLKGTKCEHLRVPAWEYYLKVERGKGRFKEHLKKKKREGASA
jgi:hypothetical protein